jgi:predicted branched-subunit amino acid permease
MTTNTRTESRPLPAARTRGAVAALTMLPAIAPLGLAVGVALADMSTSPLISWLSAPLMVAGAAQLVLLGQIDSGSAFLPAAAAAILLNARFVIYGAALARRFSTSQPAWFRAIGPHYIVDQTYAMSLNDIADSDSDETFRRYFMTAGTLLWASWSATVAVGILIGPVLPPQIPLDFVLPASFVALIAPTITRPHEVVTVLVGAVAVVATASSSTALAVAAVGGAAIGAIGRRSS